MNAVVEQALFSKIRTPSPQQVAEVDDFAEFLTARSRKNAALDRLLAIAPALQAAGVPPMSEEEITAEIRAARADQGGPDVVSLDSVVPELRPHRGQREKEKDMMTPSRPLRPLPVPDGHGSWLEYAIAGFNGREIELEYLFDGRYAAEPVKRDEVRSLVREEFDALRVQAGLPPMSWPD